MDGMPSLLLYRWLTMCFSSAAEPVCAALKVSSTLCPDITFNTTVTDAAATDKVIKDKISREGAGSAGADCFLSIRRTLCLTHYRKCDPAAGGKLVPVCTSVRKHAFTVCAKGGAFADSSVIDANLDGSAFGDDDNCIAVAVGTKAEDAKPANATSNATSAQAAAAASTPPLRACTIADMMATYEDHCAQRHTRTLILQKKPDVHCNDTDALDKTERTVLCPCSPANLRNYTSACSPDGKRTVITYQSDVEGQHCDRRLSVPAPVNVTCTPPADGAWAYRKSIHRDFGTLRWSMRTGCAPAYCFNGTEHDTALKQHDPNCTVSPADCKNWRLTDAGAHIESLSTNLTSFLEFEVSSLDTVEHPAVIFTFNVTTDAPIDVGLRAKLDGIERMPLVSNQTHIAGYEIALTPGHKHHLRWEWLGSGDQHGNASIHEVALRNAFAEINTRPSMPRRPAPSPALTPPASIATPAANHTDDAKHAPSPPPPPPPPPPLFLLTLSFHLYTHAYAI
ncbi:hypothetical protein SYNPS1DRAFT_29864, partial [Syncephalis pseudoplumigaleata]